MIQKSKSLTVIGSILIGFISLLIILLTIIFAGIVQTEVIDITVETGSAFKEYDGSYLKNSEFKLTSGELFTGHSLKLNFTGFQTEVGQSDNTAEIYVYDSNGTDVTKNYNITPVYGKLVIGKRTIAVSSNSISKEYDGKPIEGFDYELAEGSLVPGHTISAKMLESLSDVGQANNNFSVKIIDDKANDVTHNYEITTSVGLLTVTKRYITITSASDEKTYDGEELTKHDYEITNGSILSSHKVSIDWKGAITNVGEVENEFEVTILDKNDVDVTHNYEITKEFGNLKVNKKELEIISGSSAKEYDGTELTCHEYEITSGEVLSNHSIDITYLSTAINVGDMENEFTVQILDEEDHDVTENYNISKKCGTLSITPRYIEITSGSARKEYDGTALTKHESNITYGNLLIGHYTDVSYIGEITNVGEVENKCLVTIYDENGLDVTNNYQVEIIAGKLEVTKRSVEISSASAEKEYDGKPLTKEGYTITNGSVLYGHKIKPVYNASITDVGEAPNDITVTITDSYGDDVTGNYDITYNDGLLKILPIELTIASSSKTKEYDGTELTYEDYEIAAGSLLSKHLIEPNFYGTITNVGETENGFAVEIYDFYGENVSRNYNVTYLFGKLKVTPREITIISHSDSKEYDGTPLTNSKYEVGTTTPLLYNHFIYSMEFLGSQTNVGVSDNIFNPAGVVIYDNYYNNVSANYSINPIYGKLEVTERSFVITSGSAKQEYNGRVFSYSQCEYDENQLLYGHYVEVEYYGKITNVGTAPNEFTVKIVDRYGVDVTNNYKITKNSGVLEIVPRVITFESASATKEYDGLALTAKGSEIINGSLVSGHEYSVKYLSSLINVGKIENEISITIKDRNNTDVTYNYDFIFKNGTLEVTPIKLSVLSENASKVYDGTPLIYEKFKIVSGNVLPTHLIDYLFTGSITNVGTAENTFILQMFDENDVNVSNNYEITYTYGKLTVTEKKIIITTATDQKIYDGTPLTNSTYVVSTLTPLVSGHYISDIVISGTITNVGSTNNTLEGLIVLDEYDEDVTQNYVVEEKEGTLTIVPRNITIQSGSASKNYDGTPLTNQDYEIVSDTKLVETDTLYVKIVGFRTEIGESDNHFGEIIVYDQDGNDITYNYNIEKILGKLLVKDESGKTIYDNEIGSNPSISEEELERVVMYVTSTITDLVYLRQISYGDYDGKSFSASPVYTGTYYTNPVYLSSLTLLNNSYDENTITIKFNFDGEEYFLPYYTTNNKKFIDNDYQIYIENNGEYTLNYISYQYDNIPLSIMSQFAAFENNYYEFVIDNYLNVPSTTKEALLEIAQENGLDPSSPTIITEVAEYIQNAAEYNLDFEKYPDGVDTVVYFLTTAKEGICQHYAAAATLMLRSLGIPARYTTGYVAETKANEEVEVKVKHGHAWVEVYIKGMGWVNLEVTGSDPNAGGGGSSGGGGTGEGEGSGEGDSSGDITSKKITVVPVLTKYYYDGVTTFYPNNEIQQSNIIKELLSAGYTYSVSVAGERKEPGRTVTSIDSFIIYDKDGNDVTSNFDIYLKNGSLYVYKKDITLTSDPYTGVYNGMLIPNGELTLTGELEEGHYIESYRFTVEICNVGKYRNIFTDVVIKNEFGEDVTDWYNIRNRYGVINISSREILVTVGSAQKYFDGTELVCHSVSITSNDGLGLIEGHELTCEYVGSQTKIGRSDNTITEIVIKDQFGNDVTNNYSIDIVNGKLTVLPAIS